MFTTAQLLDPENVFNVFEERRTTVIEQLAEEHQNALGGVHLQWSELDAGLRRQRVVAMTIAVALLPDSSLYWLRDGSKPQAISIKATATAVPSWSIQFNEWALLRVFPEQSGRRPASRRAGHADEE